MRIGVVRGMSTKLVSLLEGNERKAKLEVISFD